MNKACIEKAEAETHELESYYIKPTAHISHYSNQSLILLYGFMVTLEMYNSGFTP